MKSVEISIIFWGIYLVLLGFCLLAIPLPTVALFGYTGTEDLWIRMLGVLSTVLGLYYIQVALHNIRILYAWKIAGHIFGIICMLVFWSSGVADERIGGTLVVEAAACLWTSIALWRPVKG